MYDYDLDLDDLFKEVEEEREEGRDDRAVLKEEWERLENIVDPKDNSVIDNGTLLNDTSDNLVRQYRVSADEPGDGEGEKAPWEENVSTMGKESGESFTLKYTALAAFWLFFRPIESLKK
jgi:hypothetical protein